ncbi:general secretion pathway protein GspD [Cyanobium sp. Maggiore-St4-Cus]|nr:general secretion pathway protein GspD [Cyanobium sp. Maggiore-St4-Cus]
MGSKFGRRFVTAAAAAVLPSFVLLDAVGQAGPRQSAAGAPASATGQSSSSFRGSAGVAAGPIQLQVRRLGNAVELVVQGVGAAPQLQQSMRSNGWQGQLLTAIPTGLRSGPQRISLPELGFQSVSLDGSGSSYSLSVTPMPGVPLARPVVSADGVNLILTFPASPQISLQTNRLDLSQPGAVPLPTYAPPLQPRAVAPPLGDMAVGTMMMQNPSYVKISGPRITLTLRESRAKDALMAIAKIGGYGFVMIDEREPDKSNYQFDYGLMDADVSADAKARVGKVSLGSRPVTAFFVNEKYETVLNSVLLSAGLQGRLEGRVIFAGLSAASKSFGAVMSKTYRLNQASSESAAEYLNSLGASIAVPGFKIGLGVTSSGPQDSDQSQDSGRKAKDGQQEQNQDEAARSTRKITQADTYSASTGPLLGLGGTIDPRLQTITLVGSQNAVIIAEKYLRQIDLRQRQVALSIKILDITLDNDTDINNSFALRLGNNFIVNDEGRLVGAFNNFTPPGTVIDSSLPFPGFNQIAQGANPARNPGLAYGNNNLYDLVRASIQSRNTKVLASPTLILSENSEAIGGAAQQAQISSNGLVGSSATIGRERANESFVTVGEQVITNYQVKAGQNGAPNSCQPELGIAGLTFGARVNRIDDNGFVTFTISPQISAVTRQQNIGGCGPIDILSLRRLDTGSARVRDGQTLVMTGVISDVDQSAVTKWPILGDIPFVGQYFRNSSNQRQKRELVILVTPRLLDDEQGGLYGYGYRPSTSQARELMGGSGF